MDSAVVAMPSKFNIVMIHKDKIIFHTFFFKKKIFTRRPLLFELTRRGTILEINTLFVSVLLLFATSTIFLAIASGSWLDLKSFVLHG